jgi:hypothetical protein
VRESSTKPLAPLILPQELLLTPPPAGARRPDTQGWLCLMPPARTRRLASTPAPRWLWCVVASERLRCYTSLDDYYKRDAAAFTIHLSLAVVRQVVGRHGRMMLNITLNHFYDPELPPKSIHTFEAPTPGELQRKIEPQP